ncbi:DNA-3-methyladenine glycosylase I [Halalkalibacterium ligniniphilum]|uniref:DNA-3-methyladenine glycosylase I n=1 Tax=Halalkalibacterium ligniniphilum TaxID=1134413 RepID=UPI00034B1AA5|nr:DNA-3-methyladenine glycosylase I [Halalkalibacterium ligniniphilum]
MIRCSWCGNDPLLIQYHDLEWGRPLKNDRDLFEALTLELFQSGLSWRTVLHKRERFREVFKNFDVTLVSRFTEKEIEELLLDAGIIRHRKKIEATIKNSLIVSDIQERHESFAYWLNTLPETIDEKKMTLSKTFQHIGPTTAESFLEAAGLIPAKHDINCFLYAVGKHN